MREHSQCAVTVTTEDSDQIIRKCRGNVFQNERLRKKIKRMIIQTLTAVLTTKAMTLIKMKLLRTWKYTKWNVPNRGKIDFGLRWPRSKLLGVTSISLK